MYLDFKLAEKGLNMTDFETWLHDVGYDRIFRMLKLRRVGDWTPYEIGQKYIDQDQYEDNHYNFIKIVEVIELPDKDILIGYKEIVDYEDLDANKFDNLPIYYKKLSQIELSFFSNDMKKENWD